MENTVQSKISEGYKLIMWGVLLTAAHITIVSYEILPSFMGHILIFLGIKKLYRDVNIEYFENSYKSARNVLILSVIYWIWKAIIGLNTEVLTGCIQLMVLILEAGLFGEFLNKTVKLLKENDKIKLADKMRKQRMTFIKFYLGVILIFAAALVPAFNVIGVYAAPMIMLAVKIFLSLLVQNVARSQVIYNENTKNLDNDCK